MRRTILLLVLSVLTGLSCISWQRAAFSKPTPSEERGRKEVEPKQLGYWISGLVDRSERRRQTAIRKLGRLKDPRALPHLLELLDSDYEWDRIRALHSIRDISGIENRISIKDGSGTLSTAWRPLPEVKEDCSSWIARHREEVFAPIESSSKTWDKTPIPDLPGLGVAFSMTPDDIMRIYKRRGIECKYHEKRRWNKNGQSFFARERVTASQFLFAPLNDKLLDVSYEFMNGLLVEIAFTRLLTRKAIVEPLKGPLKLKPKRSGAWTGLDGKIVVYSTEGDAEKETFLVEMNFGQFDR